MENYSAKEFVQHIISGNKSVLARAITLIESNLLQHQLLAEEILTGCLPHAGNSLRIGITGVPGAGKSTFIEALGNIILQQDKRIAVLAIDPSSQKSKGSILGDKTRMEKLSAHTEVFIRPTPSGITQGGVAAKTRETILLLEAAGYNVILVETVGVGQSEVAVHSMTDFFLLLMISGAGDELQGIKRGIMEMADLVTINKADGKNLQNAELSRMDMKRALHLFSATESGWIPKVTTCSALENTGIEKIWNLILEFESITKTNGYFENNRKQQRIEWFNTTLQNEIVISLLANTKNLQLKENYLSAVNDGTSVPSIAARRLSTILLESGL